MNNELIKSISAEQLDALRCQDSERVLFLERKMCRLISESNAVALRPIGV